ncbi:MAG TPA: uroporphyrinogen-III synthase, partial [Candidatus Kapabacteria bacterium]
MPTVLVTRPASRNFVQEEDAFYRMLNNAGIQIVEIPLISFSFPDDLSKVDSALHQATMGEYDYLVFSSPTGVRFFEERSKALGIWENIR